MVHKLKWCGSSTALSPVDHDEIRRKTSGKHCLDQSKELPGMSHTQFEADRLATGKSPQLGNELHHLNRCRKSRVLCRRYAIPAHRYLTNARNFTRHLRSR